eukprot:gene15208-biopygen6653
MLFPPREVGARWPDQSSVCPRLEGTKRGPCLAQPRQVRRLKNDEVVFPGACGALAFCVSALAWDVAGMALALWAPQEPGPAYGPLATSGAAIALRLSVVQ